MKLADTNVLMHAVNRAAPQHATARDWLAAPAVTLLHPGEQHLPLLARLLIGAGTAGNLTNDAHLAALAIEHGATLVSFDRDFARFAGLSFELLV